MITLREYQKDILKHLENLPSGAIFAGTGSGKTIMSLERSLQNRTKHLLVFCPSKVVPQWQNVINELYSKNYNVIMFKKAWSAAKKDEFLSENDFSKPQAVVVGIESCSKFDNLLKLVDDTWTIIVDESHKIKEMGSEKKPIQQTSYILKFRDLSPYKLILTATPTQKALGGYIDYYSQLFFLGYIDYTLKGFKGRYCNMKKMQLPGMPYPISIIESYKNTSELDALLKKVAVSYTAKFNDFEAQHLRIDIDKPQTYEKLRNERFYLDLDLDNLSRKRIAKKTLCTGTIMGRDMYSSPLMYEDNNNKIEWLKEFLSNKAADEKIIVFYKHKVELETLEKLMKELEIKYTCINGSVSSEEKIENVSKDWEVLLGQFDACSESIDGLQYKSHICIYFALPESSVVYKQSLGRINRVGQEFMPVYYYLVCKKTIEEEIWRMLEKKVEFQEEMLDRLSLEEEK